MAQVLDQLRIFSGGILCGASFMVVILVIAGAF